MRTSASTTRIRAKLSQVQPEGGQYRAYTEPTTKRGGVFPAFEAETIRFTYETGKLRFTETSAEGSTRGGRSTLRGESTKGDVKAPKA
jgi:hypothetical protein